MKVPVLLYSDYIEDIRPAVSKIHGYERRSYMAETVLKHCEGNRRRSLKKIKETDTVFDNIKKKDYESKKVRI